MSTTTVTHHEYAADPERIRHAAASGPVVITEHGEPAQVLMSVAAWRALAATARPAAGIVELLAMPDADDLEFEVPASQLRCRPADLS